VGAKHPIAWQPVAAGHTKGARMTGWRKRQVLELALKDLEAAQIDGNCQYGATEIIRKALAQPERTWVGLTEEDKQIAVWTDGTFGGGALWAEAELKEKNT
jgi:hypothetical protein